MDALYKVALVLHIAAGAVALSVFWLPLVVEKGARTHRRAGWVYVGAALFVALSGLVVCGRLIADPSPFRHRAGIFLAYIGLFAAASAHFGVRALREKHRTGASHAPVDLAPPLLLVAGGIGLAAFGLREAMPLYGAFAALGIAQGVARLRFWLRPPATSRAWFYAHMSGMGTSCITTVTAFVVVNARSLGLRTFDLAVWLLPPLVGAVGLTLWQRSYRRREAAAQALRANA